MARYIDADKIPCFLSVGDDTPIEGIEIAYKHDIDKLPTADVVEVVRCSECKHRYSYEVFDRDRQENLECRGCHILREDFGDNSFCSYGERKRTIRSDER